MIMEERVQKALECHKDGCNCSQAVLCAYADLFGMDHDTAYRIAEPFGRGIGDRSGICGAISGALMVAGLAFSEGSQVKGNKNETYDIAAKIVSAFREKNGAVICRELKGMDDGKPLRSCMGCIEDAAVIIGEILNEQEKI
jgi:C_GCAxxG_C_C family probable redox protein